MEKKTVSLTLETGGILRLSPSFLKELRAPVGTTFLLHPVGEVLTVYRKGREEEDLSPWLENLTLMGKAGSFTIADLFSLLSLSQKSGVLRFLGKEVVRDVFFRNGEVTFARTNDPSFRLGAILVKRGLITEEKLQEVLRIQEKEGGRLGGILVKKGFLTPPKLFEAVRYQVEEIIYSIFSFTEGTFLFFENVTVEEGLEEFVLNTQNLLMEGYRRLDEWQIIREKIPNEKVVLLRKVPEYVGKPETKAEPIVFNLIDGKRNVAQILKESGLGEFDVYRALYDLLRRGLIDTVATQKRVEKPSSSLEEILSAYNRLFAGMIRILNKFSASEVYMEDQIRAFVDSLDSSLQPILKGIAFHPELGTINPKVVLENLQELARSFSTTSTIAGYTEILLKQKLKMALDELLNYLLFSVKNLLPPKHADSLIQKVRSAQRELFQRI